MKRFIGGDRSRAVAIWLFALAMAYPYLPGSDTEAFKGLSVLLGLMAQLDPARPEVPLATVATRTTSWCGTASQAR